MNTFVFDENEYHRMREYEKERRQWVDTHGDSDESRKAFDRWYGMKTLAGVLDECQIAYTEIA